MNTRCAISKFCGFASSVLRSYREDNGSLIAASISFYAFASLVPLLVLCLSVTAWFLGSLKEAENAVLRLVGQYYPAASGTAGHSVRAIVKEIVDSRSAATWLGAPALLWSGLSVINSLSRAINVAWKVSFRRGFFAQKLIDILLFMSVLAILGVSVALTAFVEILKEAQLSVFGLGQGAIAVVWNILGYLVPLVVTTIAYVIVYYVAPITKVRFRAALVGAVFSGILWEVAKVGFGLYVGYLAARTSIYGSLGGLFLLLMWIYYSSIVVILGAEVASEYQRRWTHAG